MASLISGLLLGAFSCYAAWAILWYGAQERRLRVHSRTTPNECFPNDGMDHRALAIISPRQ